MGDNTRIGWTDASWTPLRWRHRTSRKIGWHCTHVSDGCRFCYAEAINVKLGTGLPFEPASEKLLEPYLDTAILMQPLHWTRPRRVFPCSMTDLFHPSYPRHMLELVWAVMMLTERHTFQVLTKRPDRMADFLEGLNIAECLAKLLDLDPTVTMRGTFGGAHIQLGTSVENQRAADDRIDDLLRAPAKIHFLSLEPLLGRVDLAPWLSDPMLASSPDQHVPDVIPQRLNWFIIGGESGEHYRVMDLAWAEDLIEQADDAGIPVYLKQDSGRYPGRQGRLPDRLWRRKDYPA